jgi:hypothetical protein
MILKCFAENQEIPNYFKYKTSLKTIKQKKNLKYLLVTKLT